MQSGPGGQKATAFNGTHLEKQLLTQSCALESQEQQAKGVDESTEVRYPRKERGELRRRMGSNLFWVSATHTGSRHTGTETQETLPPHCE